MTNELIILPEKTTIDTQPENKIYNYDTFNNYHPKIISFSLWKDSEIYNYGIVENALVAKEKLPEFKIYIYYNNTILTKTFNILKKLDKLSNTS